MPEISWFSVIKPNGTNKTFETCFDQKPKSEYFIEEKNFCHFVDADSVVKLHDDRCTLYWKEDGNFYRHECMYQSNCDFDQAGSVCQMDIDKKVRESTDQICTMFPENREPAIPNAEKLDVAKLSMMNAALPFELTALSDDKKQGLGFSYDEVIHTCTRSGVPCNRTMQIRTWMDPNYGNCFLHEPNEKKGNDTTVETAGMAGIKFHMATDVAELVQLSETSGLRVIIQEPGQVTFPNVHGISVPQHFHTSFKVRRITKTMINKRKRPCHPVETDPDSYFYAGAYTVEGCLRSCAQMKIFEECGCYNPNMGIPANASSDAPRCQSSEDAWCAREVEDLVKSNATTQAFHCGHCTVGCKTTFYEVTASQALLKDQKVRLQGIPDLEEKVILPNKLRARVDVSMVAQSYRHDEERLEKTIPRVAGDLGGIFGICLGVSAITILEVVFMVCFWKDG